VLFIAVAMSITAVPVLASIIAERGIATTVPAVVAMAAAGLIDGIGWLALTAAVLLGGGSSAGDRSLTRTAVLFAVYIAVMVGVVRPALMRWMRRPGALVRDNIPVIIAVAMISAWVTAALGLHVIFGAFLAGVIMPRTADGAPDAELVRPLHQAAGLLLPLFFVVSGLPVNLTGMTAGDLALLAMVCGIAVVGKLGGGGLGAWLGGLPVREAKAVGVMLNTRGLTELIALNIGLRAGLIDGRIYTVLVVMALLTTALTGLLLNRLSVGVEAGVEAGADGSGIDQAAVRPAVATPSAGAWPASKAGTADPSLSRESLRDGR
jgi:Kef-type K+ transport system membrane component KefB